MTRHRLHHLCRCRPRHSSRPQLVTQRFLCPSLSQYMGAYTVENMQVMEDLNPHLGDLDQVKPGDTVQVWDRRRGVFEPEVRSLARNSNAYSNCH